MLLCGSIFEQQMEKLLNPASTSNPAYIKKFYDFKKVLLQSSQTGLSQNRRGSSMKKHTKKGVPENRTSPHINRNSDIEV